MSQHQPCLSCPSTTIQSYQLMRCNVPEKHLKMLSDHDNDTVQEAGRSVARRWWLRAMCGYGVRPEYSTCARIWQRCSACWESPACCGLRHCARSHQRAACSVQRVRQPRTCHSRRHCACAAGAPCRLLLAKSAQCRSDHHSWPSARACSRYLQCCPAVASGDLADLRVVRSVARRRGQQPPAAVRRVGGRPCVSCGGSCKHAGKHASTHDGVQVCFTAEKCEIVGTSACAVSICKLAFRAIA